MKKYEEHIPKVTVFSTEEEVDRYVANKLISEIQDKPSIKLTLPTGKTPEAIYKLLVDAHQKKSIDFSNVVVCNLDEYWPLDSLSPDSYAAYMRNHLIDHINIKAENWHIPMCDASNPDQEAERFDQLVSRIGIDLAVLGLGPGLTNHIGFNEPGSDFDSRTRLVTIDPVTVKVNQQHFSNPDSFVDTAITQGLGTIMEAKEILLIVKGKKKAAGVARFLQGDIGPDSPASVLRSRTNVEIVLDSAAAQSIKKDF